MPYCSIPAVGGCPDSQRELSFVVPVRLPGSTLSTYPRTVFDTPTPLTYWTVVPMFVSCRSYWGIRP